MLHNLHPTAGIFIQHPLRNQNLNSTGKRHLYLVRSEMRTLPDHCHRLAKVRMVRIAKVRMVRIVDRGGTQNMGRVWVLCRSLTLPTLPGFVHGTRLAASLNAAKRAFSFLLRWSEDEARKMWRLTSRVKTQPPRVSGRFTDSGPFTFSTDYLVICGRASARSMESASDHSGVPRWQQLELFQNSFRYETVSSKAKRVTSKHPRLSSAWTEHPAVRTRPPLPLLARAQSVLHRR